MLKSPVFIGLLAATLGVLFHSAVPNLVLAHGSEVQLNKKEFAGPYEVSLGTAPDPPSVGALSMIMTVIQRAGRVIVVDAEITVTAVGPNATLVELGPIKAAPDADDPEFYELNTTVDREGTWVFTIEVDAESGKASADFAIEVRNRSTVSRIITLLTMLAFVSIVGFLVRMFLKERRRGQSVKRGSA